MVEFSIKNRKIKIENSQLQSLSAYLLNGLDGGTVVIILDMNERFL